MTYRPAEKIELWGREATVREWCQGLSHYLGRRITEDVLRGRISYQIEKAEKKGAPISKTTALRRSIENLKTEDPYVKSYTG